MQLGTRIYKRCISLLSFVQWQSKCFCRGF